jgi:hypothetical protein
MEAASSLVLARLLTAVHLFFFCWAYSSTLKTENNYVPPKIRQTSTRKYVAPRGQLTSESNGCKNLRSYSKLTHLWFRNSKEILALMPLSIKRNLNFRFTGRIRHQRQREYRIAFPVVQKWFLSCGSRSTLKKGREVVRTFLFASQNSSKGCNDCVRKGKVVPLIN